MLILIILSVALCSASTFGLYAVPTRYQDSMDLLLNVSMLDGPDEVNGYMHIFIDYIINDDRDHE